MNGEITLPCVKIIKAPNKASTINIGIRKNFLLTNKNLQNSLIKLILKLIFHFTYNI